MPERGRKGVAIDRKTGVSKQPMKRLGNEEKELPKKGGQAGGGIVVRARYSRKVNCKQGNRKLLLWGGKRGRPGRLPLEIAARFAPSHRGNAVFPTNPQPCNLSRGLTSGRKRTAYSSTNIYKAAIPRWHKLQNIYNIFFTGRTSLPLLSFWMLLNPRRSVLHRDRNGSLERVKPILKSRIPSPNIRRSVGHGLRLYRHANYQADP